MTSQNNPNKPAGTDTGSSSSASTEEDLKPFQNASSKFLQANVSAWNAAFKQRAQAWLDFHDEVHGAEHQAFQAVMAATRKHVNAMGQQATGSIEEMNAARARGQLDFEKEVRQIHADTQEKLTAIAQKAFGEGGASDVARQFAKQRQEACQAYLAELQQALSSTKTLDPQMMNAIASTTFLTINAMKI